MTLLLPQQAAIGSAMATARTEIDEYLASYDETVRSEHSVVLFSALL